jgi:phosphoheptose isomerase
MHIFNFLENYKVQVQDGLDSIDTRIFLDIVELITNAHRARANIFVAGNGGSAAIAEHFSCDHSKGVSNNTGYFPKIISLTSNVSLLTAYANDIGYSRVFAEQLVNHADAGDLLFVISSSGNSPNIIEALKVAKQLNMKTVALTGFNGGQASNMADYNIHIDIDNYGIVEDCHQIIMHMLAQYIRIKDTVVDLKTVKL